MTLTADQVAEPVYSVPEAVARLEALGTLLSKGRDRDGLRHFNSLYLRVTRRINECLGEPGYFLDPPFLRTLDVEFANLYLTAIGHALTTDTDDPVSLPWRRLVDRRRHQGIQRFQYAAAGVNAHISYDLAFALVATWKRHSRTDGEHQWHDYQRVNAIFAQLYAPIREDLIRWIARIDIGPVRKALDDASNVLIKASRAKAWNNAVEIDEHLRSGGWEGVLSAKAKDTWMSLAAASVNRGLLQPLG
jgi:hypothetical protein